VSLYATAVTATSPAASFVVLIGDGPLLFGIVLAPAAALPFYIEKKWSDNMTATRACGSTTATAQGS
jgi:hypothetical protein